MCCVHSEALTVCGVTVTIVASAHTTQQIEAQCETLINRGALGMCTVQVYNTVKTICTIAHKMPIKQLDIRHK